jgi:hypothetical protein
MKALRRVVDDAPEEIVVPVPPEWRHRRVEVVLSTLEPTDISQATLEPPPYQVLKVRQRILASRDALHER